MSAALGVYTIVDRRTDEQPDKKSLWLNVGIAFVNRDGSINVRLNALPVNGGLHIRPFSGGGEGPTGEPEDL